MTESYSKPRWSQGWRRAALASTALSLVAFAAPGALAATTTPAANSLPGNFVAAGGTATYALSSGSTNTATIAITPSGSAVALQWGGTPPSGTAVPLTTNAGATTLPAGVTQNSGFSVGAGASVNISGGGATPILLNDASGDVSQIYGSVADSGTGALFVANPNGVIVGGTGSITVGAGGLGLLGYKQDSSTFTTGTGAGTVAIDGSSTGTGGVTIMNGASISGGPLLVASNGAVNVGAAPSASDGGVAIFAGWGVSGAPGAGKYTAGSALSNSASAVTLSGGSTTSPITTTALYSASDVTNTGVADLTGVGGSGIGSGAVTPTIPGTFVNAGVAYVGNGFNAGVINNSGKLTVENGSVTAKGLPKATTGADITNTGVINIASTGTTTFAAGGSGVAGNFDDGNGVIDFTGAGATNTLAVTAANIYLGGTLEQATSTSPAGAPLSATNYLSAPTLTASYTDQNGKTVQGVVDIAAPLWASAPTVAGQTIRILSGGDVIDPSASGGSVTLTPGAGSATDPFFKNAKLGPNLSLFPKTMVEANTVDLNGTQASSSSVGSNMNLDGVVSTQVPNAAAGTGAILVTGNTITADSAGGFAVTDGDGVYLAFSGNVNNPIGAASAGSTAFQYNYVPVSVANTAAGKTGTVNLILQPDLKPTKAQFVNLLVDGNVSVPYSPGGTAPLLPSVASDGTVSTAPITPNASYVNNHLVLQATGNINTGGSFYWPGLVYLNTAASASDPTSLSSAGSIALGGDFSNVLPAFSTGGTGIFFETNNLALNGDRVTTSNNSWVNFANATQSSAFATTLSKQFFGGYQDTVTPTVTELGLQYLPNGDFQPK